MKLKILLKVILFAVICLTPVFWVGRYDNLIIDKRNINIARLLDVPNHRDLDYLVVGNSYGYSSVYPPLFDSLNLEIYHYGIPGAGPIYYDLLIRDYIKHVENKPKFILIAISPTIFSTLSDKWHLAPYHKFLQAPLSHEHILRLYDLDFDKYLKATQGSFVRGLHWMRSRERTDIDELISKSNDYKGFYYRYDTFSNDLYRNSYQSYTSTLNDKFPQVKADQFVRMLSFIINEGMEPVIFETPRNRVDEFFSPDYLNAYFELLDQLKESDFKVLENELELDSTHYRDMDHLNHNGAIVFTKQLINRL